MEQRSDEDLAMLVKEASADLKALAAGTNRQYQPYERQPLQPRLGPPRPRPTESELSSQATKRAQVFLDRGATLVLSSLEVGPSIKALTVRTQIPSYVVANASWYMRKAGLWSGQNRSAQRTHYGWQSALESNDAEAGQRIMHDAAVAVGLATIETEASGRKVYQSRLAWATRNRGGNYQLSVVSPPCGSALALGRHRLFGETCVSCEAAAADRHRAYVKRQEMVRGDIAVRRAASERRANQEALAEARYQAFLEDEALAAAGKRQAGLQEFRDFKAEGLTLKRPREMRLDAPLGYDRFDSGWTSDHVSVFGSGHLTEWADPTFDAVANLLEYESSDPAITALTYRPLFAESEEAAQWSERSFNVYRNRDSYRVGLSVAK